MVDLQEESLLAISVEPNPIFILRCSAKRSLELRPTFIQGHHPAADYTSSASTGRRNDLGISGP